MPAGTSLSPRRGTELPTSTIISFTVMTLICTKDDPFQEDKVKASGIMPRPRRPSSPGTWGREMGEMASGVCFPVSRSPLPQPQLSPHHPA